MCDVIGWQSLLETHDSVASKTCETPPPSPQASLEPTLPVVPADAVRMVGIRKVAGEHLVRFPRHRDFMHKKVKLWFTAQCFH